MPRHMKHSVHRKQGKRAPRKTSLFKKFFYFIGFAVIVAIASYQSGLLSVSQSSVLSDSVGGDQGKQQISGQEGQEGPAQFTQPQTGGFMPSPTLPTQINRDTGRAGIMGNGQGDSRQFQVQGAKPGFQFKLEDQNGQQELQVEDTKGNTLHESDQQQLEKDLEDEGIDISTEDGKFALTRNNVKALSDRPLSVDTTRKQVMIVTPNGNTVTLLLPDAALEHLSNFGLLTNFGTGSGILAGTPSGTLTLSTTNNIPTYTVPAFKNEHFLGLFPVQVPVSAVVSAETGAVMEQNQDFVSKLLDTFSF